MKLFGTPPGAQRANGSMYCGFTGLWKFAANSCWRARAQGWNGTSPLAGSDTRLGARSLRADFGAFPPGSPPWGSVQLFWFAMVFDQKPWTSGCPSAVRGPVHLPEAISGMVFSHRLGPPGRIASCVWASVEVSATKLVKTRSFEMSRVLEI